jgi:hypothetical protein
MTNKNDMTGKHDGEPDANRLSRRAALVRSTTGVAALACALSGCATSSKVQGSAPQAEAQYQDRPSGLERCGTCKHFIPLTGCEIVAAPVQANGWCKYYALF